MKRTKYFIVGSLLTLCSSGTLFSQTVFSEDFSTASGSTPPTNWTNDDMASSTLLWVFDNPGGQTLNSPISDPAAMLDSDYFDVGASEETALVSPMFDASAYTGQLILQYDHYFSDQWGGDCYVEVYDGLMWNEIFHYDVSPTTDPEHVMIDITAAAGNFSDAQVRFRWVGNWNDYWVVDNVSVINTNCPPISFLNVSNETTSTIDLTWIAGGTETNWNIEWGLPGFAPGNGEEIGSASSTAENYQVTGLNASTDYQFYIQPDCGSETGLWVLVNGTTLCAPVTSLPWMEDFDAIVNVDYGIYPNCWYSESGYWVLDNGYNTYQTNPYSGANFLALPYYEDDVIWTPEFDLVAGENYEFSFMYAGDDFDGWSGEIMVNTTQSSTGADVLNDFLDPAVAISTDYQKAVACFSPTVSGIYTFGIRANSNYNPFYFVTIDDVSLKIRGTSAGTSGATDVCQTAGLVDLNGVVSITDADGAWYFAPNQSTIEDDSLFNPEYVPSGTVNVEYITSGCLVDTLVAAITIFPASQAGNNGSINVCRNEPLSLYDGLTGVINVGGTWYDPSDVTLSSSLITSSNFPGSFTYEYVVGNGVCEDDTSLVVVNVNSNCDYLLLENEDFSDVAVYPNPSSGIVFIESEFTGYEMMVTDVNGRQVSCNLSNVNSVTKSIDLSTVETGIYFIMLSTSSAEKVYRIVIN